VRGGDGGREVANRAKHTGTINVAWYTASLESDALEPTAPRRGVRSSSPAVSLSVKPKRQGARLLNFGADVRFPSPVRPPAALDRSVRSVKPILLGPDRHPSPPKFRYHPPNPYCRVIRRRVVVVRVFFRPVLIIHSCFR